MTVYSPAINTYVPLGSITLAAATSSVTFSNISQSYRDLVLIDNAKSSGASSDTMSIVMRFNGDSGSNYSGVWAFGNNSNQAVSQGGTYTNAYVSRVHNTYAGAGTTQIMEYSATDKHKTLLSRGNNLGNSIQTIMLAFRWANTSAITSITLTTEDASNFAIGSTFSLYGIAA